MNHLDLSQRLAAVGEFVPESARLADIGSDHAYLPVALMLKGKIKYAVAGEVVQGPYESARKQVQKRWIGRPYHCTSCKWSRCDPTARCYNGCHDRGYGRFADPRDPRSWQVASTPKWTRTFDPSAKYRRAYVTIMAARKSIQNPIRKILEENKKYMKLL